MTHVRPVACINTSNSPCLRSITVKGKPRNLVRDSPRPVHCYSTTTNTVPRDAFRHKSLTSFCLQPGNYIQITTSVTYLILIIIMYIYHALINALSAHMIHINLNMIFYTHVKHSPTKTIYIKYYLKNK